MNTALKKITVSPVNTKLTEGPRVVKDPPLERQLELLKGQVRSYQSTFGDVSVPLYQKLKLLQEENVSLKRAIGALSTSPEQPEALISRIKKMDLDLTVLRSMFDYTHNEMIDRITKARAKLEAGETGEALGILNKIIEPDKFLTPEEKKDWVNRKEKALNLVLAFRENAALKLDKEFEEGLQYSQQSSYVPEEV